MIKVFVVVLVLRISSADQLPHVLKAGGRLEESEACSVMYMYIHHVF